MAYTVFEQGDAKADNGSYKREYPIEDKKETQSIIYDREIQQISYIQGNIVGVFNDWILSFFPSNYFRHIRIKTQSTFSDFKSWMKNIYKKDNKLIVVYYEADSECYDIVLDSVDSILRTLEIYTGEKVN